MWQRAGYTRANSTTKKRMIIAVDGVEKGGKTHFALTAPEPIGVISVDIGLDGVVQKFQADKEIWVAEHKIDMQSIKTLKMNEAAEEAEKALDRLLKSYKEVLGQAKAIVWDTATEIWELVRMAEFGKLDHVKPHHYAKPNARYRDLIRMAYDQEFTNLLLLHKMKDEYVNDNRTGRKQRAGFSDTGFMVQVNALAWRDRSKDAPPVPDCFHLTIQDCRQNAELSGVDISGADLHFATLATLVFPDTNLEEWL